MASASTSLGEASARIALTRRLRTSWPRGGEDHRCVSAIDRRLPARCRSCSVAVRFHCLGARKLFTSNTSRATACPSLTWDTVLVFSVLDGIRIGRGRSLFLSKEFRHGRCFVAPFLAGVVDANGVVPHRCAAAVGEAPPDPAGAGVPAGIANSTRHHHCIDGRAHSLSGASKETSTVALQRLWASGYPVSTAACGTKHAVRLVAYSIRV